MSSDMVKKLTVDNFKETISSGLSLVDFWATWCGPCKLQKPIMEQFASKVGHEVKVCELDTDQNASLASEYNVMSIPTIILFKDGEIVKQAVGLQTLDNLEQMITSAK